MFTKRIRLNSLIKNCDVRAEALTPCFFSICAALGGGMEIVMNKPDEIIFTTESGEEVVFQVMEQTRLGGKNYLLVSTTGEEDEAEALILKDISKDTDEEAIYDIVEDERELELVADIFKELLDDVELN